MNRQSGLQIGGVVLLLLVVAFVLGRPSNDGPPLDPDSTGELGTLGLIEFLERGGASVHRGLPDADDDVALVLIDRLTGASREQLLEWIQDGGRAVVADPASPLLATGILGTSEGEDLDRGACDVPELESVERLSAASLALLAPVPRSVTCFGDSNAAYVIQFRDGAGSVTGLGGAVPLVNRQLDEGDNAVLAGRLLLSGDEPNVAVIYATLGEGVGTRSPLDLIGRNVRWFGWQLVAVTLVGLLWAMRRFGKVVSEPEVVELPGSLSVRATAELHRRSADADRSAAVIRTALMTRIRSEYRLPPEVDPQLAATVVAEQSGLSYDDAALLTGAATDGIGDPLKQIQRIDVLWRSTFGEPAEPAALPGPDLLEPSTAPNPQESSNV